MSNHNSNELIDLFSRFEWMYRRYQFQNQRNFGPMADPHRGQGRVLALLKLKPEISQKELSTILDIRSQSLGELLSKLEKAGYITRTPSEQDRRVMMISLTDLGKEAANVNNQKPEAENQLFSCLNEDEQNQLTGYMKRILEDLEKRFGKEDFGRRPRRPFPFGREGGFDHHHGGGFHGAFHGIGHPSEYHQHDPHCPHAPQPPQPPEKD